MAYELWETKSGNLIDTFATEEEALEEVRATIAEFGRETIATYSLAHETHRSTRRIAEGQALAERALANAPATAATKSPPPGATMNV
jgi:hypothetical protein